MEDVPGIPPSVMELGGAVPVPPLSQTERVPVTNGAVGALGTSVDVGGISTVGDPVVRLITTVLVSGESSEVTELAGMIVVVDGSPTSGPKLEALEGVGEKNGESLERVKPPSVDDEGPKPVSKVDEEDCGGSIGP